MNRPEYPRPQFERRKWLNLNGKWQFDFTDNLEDNGYLADGVVGGS